MTDLLAFWRRLDAPGHDACRLQRLGEGWLLEGFAAFDEGGGPAGLAYFVEYDAAWASRSGGVRGFAGGRKVDLSIVHDEDGWIFNGARAPGLERLVDLDYGFTPATNVPQIKRVPPAAGASVQLPAAWLDVGAGTLTELPQRYERRGATTIWYESPTAGYEALLEIAPSGFVSRYPGLWETEAG
jgi:hypothetical protein